MLYNKALAPMISRAMSKTALTRSVGLLRPSFAVGMVRTYYRAFEDQATILPNHIDTHKPEFKVRHIDTTLHRFINTAPCESEDRSISLYSL
jgi:hypothetical protein